MAPTLRAAASLALATLGLLAAPASAQWRNPYTGNIWNNPTSSLVDTMLRGRMMKDLMSRAAKKDSPAAKPAAGAARVTYRPSPSRVPEEFSASLLETEADRAELTRYLRQVLEVYVAKAREEGRPNDVGHALTFFVAGNYSVLHEGDVSDAAQVSLNRQLDELLASSASLTKAGDGQKQRLAEHFVCSTFFVLAGYQQGKQLDRPEQVKLYRGLAAKNLESLLQVEAGRLRLDDGGLRME